MSVNPPVNRPFLPPRWFIRTAWRIHRSLYRVSTGRLGLRPPRATQYGLMRLTAMGRRTGRERSVMLAYFEDGPDLVTLAMNGWASEEPAWWLNLLADPEAEVQLVDEVRRVTASSATDQERDRLWRRWSEIDEKLDAYAARRGTETTVVVLKPAS